ncbi:MAG: tetratricopeptide repeat protein [Bacteroidota bacterium]|jgi:antitoxin component YwqK of YwqJK toxin-antitoxin module/Tfp pilus assembly protein PilF
MITFWRGVALVCLIGIVGAHGQQVPLIKSADIISEAIALHDSGRYEEAIARYKTIPPRDTAYTQMLSELALSYDAAGRYDEAIATCREALKHPGPYESHVLRTLAAALDHKGNYEESVEVFKAAIEKFPFDHLLHYNLGVTHYNSKHYDEAAECFFNTLKINPYHGGSHLNLGRLAAFQGGKVRAMMALGVYLAIAPEDNSRLVFLEKFLNNEIPEEGTFPYNGTKAYDRLDQIIKAKVVTDKNFKPLVPVEAILTRQYQLFIDQIDMIGDPGDIWAQLYLQLYRQIRDQKMLEPFLYHILSSTSIASVSRWQKKHEKELKSFYSLANANIVKHRLQRSVPASWGFPDPVSCWYDGERRLVELGNKQGDLRVGKWRYYAPNHVMIAEGEYNDKGEKRGIWKYYYSDGTLKSVENEDTGEIHAYNRQGELRFHYFIKDGKAHGEVMIFDPCGGIREKLAYHMGKRSGPGTLYYADGSKEATYTFKDDNFDGQYISYYPDGTLKSRSIYQDGKLHGPFEEYYASGVLQTKGNYEDGEATGPWEYFHMNGKLEKKGSFKAGLAHGIWSYYDTRGNITEERPFDDEGQLHGENNFYTDGRLYATQFYRHGVMTGVAYFDSDGEEISRSGDPSGTFAVRGYYRDGKLRFEGHYREGKPDGLWKYYYRSGGLEKEYTIVNGRTEGNFTEYYSTGQVKYEQDFREGEPHGYSVEYYKNGQPKEAGWYQFGERVQQWLSWYRDGTVKSDVYYREGKLDGEASHYNVDGTLSLKHVYREGRVISSVNFDPEGKIWTEVSRPEKEGRYVQKYQNGVTHTRWTLNCGFYNDTVASFYPDGKLHYSYEVMNGYYHGSFVSNYPNGNPEVKGMYEYGSRHGTWTWYHENGRLSSEGTYVADERDSLWTWYNIDGSVSMKAHYLNGERHGLAQYFGTDGSLVLEKRYDEGDVTAYRARGRDGEMSEWVQVAPEMTLVAYYPNGAKAYEEHRKNGRVEGPVREFYPDGRLLSEYIYDQGDETGPFSVYHPNGRLWQKGTYDAGSLQGVVEFFNPDGTPFLKETRRDGTLHGKYVLYKNSQPVTTFTYWSGTLID